MNTKAKHIMESETNAGELSNGWNRYQFICDGQAHVTEYINEQQAIDEAIDLAAFFYDQVVLSYDNGSEWVEIGEYNTADCLAKPEETDLPAKIMTDLEAAHLRYRHAIQAARDAAKLQFTEDEALNVEIQAAKDIVAKFYSSRQNAYTHELMKRSSYARR